MDFNKDYYIVDCTDFVYFPKKVKIIGICGSTIDEKIEYIINDKESYSEEYRKMYEWELTRFNNMEEAKDYAKYLNDIPKNKKLAKKWKKDKIYIEMLGDK